MQQMVRISSKRQITIPAAMYKKLQLRKGQNLIVNTANNRITLTPAELLVHELAGSVKIPEHLRGIDLDKAIEEAKRIHFSKKYGTRVR